MEQRRDISAESGEEGFMLLGAVVLIFLVMLTLSVAAAKVSRDLRRDREVEAIHRGNEYVRAIQLYYRKFGHYPGNVEQLEKSNNIRFLRQKYDDPMTGKPDWRIIHQGEAKTTVKGFFGQPLAGLPGGAGGLGSASSLVSGGQTSTVGGSSSLGGSSTLGGTSSSSGGFSLGSGTSNSPGSTSPLGASNVSSSSGSSSGVSSQSATSATGGGGAIVGIGSSKSGVSISVLNEQTTYETWEFLYDPRIEQLKQKAALLGGASSTNTNSLGSGGSTTSPTNSNPFGNSNNSPFGSSTPGSSGTTSPSTLP